MLFFKLSTFNLIVSAGIFHRSRALLSRLGFDDNPFWGGCGNIRIDEPVVIFGIRQDIPDVVVKIKSYELAVERGEPGVFREYPVVVDRKHDLRHSPLWWTLPEVTDWRQSVAVAIALPGLRTRTILQ